MMKVAPSVVLLFSAGAAIGGVAVRAGSTGDTIAVAALGGTLLLLAVLDIRHFWLPSAMTLPLVVAGLAATAALDPAALPAHIVGAGAGYASLTAAAALYRRARGRIGLGGGDARLFAASGAWLGWTALPLVLAAAAVAGLVVALLWWRGRISATARLPFGVFLGAATWLIYVSRSG